MFHGHTVHNTFSNEPPLHTGGVSMESQESQEKLVLGNTVIGPCLDHGAKTTTPDQDALPGLELL